ncbi:hypothetical protein BGZ97_004760 [Linnemannia gamsii]|uniref:Uncharacterized protein n=1 Tax=Linnemannia gamsii TaxID=64522 RepID=A0A9P6QSS2_9FUNG|nr:hypothetical protein BGZ97_004760 [Linnemannia gamsii]
MSVKPCVAKGHRECVQGFLRERCNKCTKGSVLCGLCPTNSSSNSCIFCVDGRKECDDCYGAGFVQRICRDCIKQHYRQQQQQSPTKNMSESFLQATMGFVKGVHSQTIQRTLSHEQKQHRMGSTVSLPESIAASEHSTASASSLPSSSRTGGSKGRFFLRRLSLDHERTSPSSTSTTASSSPSKKSHRRKWSWSSILTAA